MSGRGEARHARRRVLSSLTQLRQLRFGVGSHIQLQLPRHGERARTGSAGLCAQPLVPLGIDRAAPHTAVLCGRLLDSSAAAPPCAHSAHDVSASAVPHAFLHGGQECTRMHPGYVNRLGVNTCVDMTNCAFRSYDVLQWALCMDVSVHSVDNCRSAIARQRLGLCATRAQTHGAGGGESRVPSPGLGVS